MTSTSAPSPLEHLPSGQVLLVPGSRPARARVIAWFLACSIGIGAIAALSPASPIPTAFRVGCVMAGMLVGLGAAYVSAAYGPRLSATRFSFGPQAQVSVTNAQGKLLHQCEASHPSLELRADSGAEVYQFVWAHGRASAHLSERDFNSLLGLGVRASKAPLKEVRRDWIMWLMVLFATVSMPALAIYQRVFPQAIRIEARAPEIVGSLHVESESLGSWDLSPAQCLSGRERGFQGIAFLFLGDSAVKEVRLDTERKGANVLYVLFSDPRQRTVHIRENECAAIEGRVERELLEINGRDFERLRGQVSIDCSAKGLRGSVRFDGCLPKPL